MVHRLREGFILLVEPKHKMYLNALSYCHNRCQKFVEPKHKMYLNVAAKKVKVPPRSVEPKHKMYLNYYQDNKEEVKEHS